MPETPVCQPTLLFARWEMGVMTHGCSELRAVIAGRCLGACRISTPCPWPATYICTQVCAHARARAHTHRQMQPHTQTILQRKKPRHIQDLESLLPHPGVLRVTRRQSLGACRGSQEAPCLWSRAPTTNLKISSHCWTHSLMVLLL